ncbi:MAG: hypothetical protein K2Q28_09890 [Hyphomicrobium sp.]|nr:hypothetical protein [Hyphomicrobium sp.]
MTAMLPSFDVGKVLSACTINEAKRLLATYNIATPSTQHIDILITDLFPRAMKGSR